MIAYVPQPSTVTAPEKQLEDAVNFGVPTPAKVEVTDTLLKATSIDAVSGTVDTRVLNFSKVSTMTLGKGAFYVVTVLDASGDKLYSYYSDDLKPAQQFMDALEAIHQRTSHK